MSASQKSLGFGTLWDDLQLLIVDMRPAHLACQNGKAISYILAFSAIYPVDRA